MSLDNIKPLLVEYGQLRMERDTLNARMKELEGAIRPVLVDHGEVVADGFAFTCTMTAGRKTLDKKALEAAGIDLEPFYKQGAPFTTLKVKTVEEL